MICQRLDPVSGTLSEERLNGFIAAFPFDATISIAAISGEFVTLSIKDQLKAVRFAKV